MRVVKLLRKILADSRRIEASRADAGKVSLALCCGEYRERYRSRRLVKPRALIVSEEEELVLDDGAADRGAKFIPAKDRLEACSIRIVGTRDIRLSLGEPILPFICIEGVVANELEDVAVELVGSRLEGDADDTAQIVTVGGWRVLRDEVELLDGIDTGREG